MRKMYTKFWSGNLNSRDLLRDVGVGVKKMLKCILRKQLVSCGLDSTGSGQGPVAGSCEHDNGSWGCVNAGNLLIG
jgi:hypothetical protein